MICMDIIQRSDFELGRWQEALQVIRSANQNSHNFSKLFLNSFWRSGHVIDLPDGLSPSYTRGHGPGVLACYVMGFSRRDQNDVSTIYADTYPDATRHRVVDGICESKVFKGKKGHHCSVPLARITIGEPGLDNDRLAELYEEGLDRVHSSESAGARPVLQAVLDDSGRVDDILSSLSLHSEYIHRP